MKPYYDYAGITIYHGDCMEILPDIDFDVLLTDPPYGVSGKQNTKTAKRKGGCKNRYTQFIDSVEYVKSTAVRIVFEYVTRNKRCVITPGNRCVTLYPIPDSFGAIYQPASVGLQSWGHADAQPILYYGPSPYGGKKLPGQACSFVSTENSNAEASGHPCPKPLKLWKKLVLACSIENEMICDPFMGSGTTLRAAKDLGRRAIGIEIEEEYCEIAAKRLSQEVFDFG